MAGDYGTIERTGGEERVLVRRGRGMGLKAAAVALLLAVCLLAVLAVQEPALRRSQLLQVSWDYVDDSMDPDYQVEPVDDPDDNQYNSDFLDLSDETGAGDISVNMGEEGYSDPAMSNVEPGRVMEVARQGQLDPEHTKTRNYEFPVI
mmetsp:Transcript_25987/g.40657  ORF Transcript_25987/g.40657 Transcript_25987/m.40657 type:complete len:148 (-) Transcript_25987:31-474(-)|eukprot:CAMPEP_0184311778 /NCGR_PEP_ID=MMETSP1049-20130417/45137_1 /TAXON_ID=77928 /ORGANISM="Proteomonas sulcata, Strain CCMP704" /LENGTH=147 /DNA_ID=CAMNT_0026627449 /DNA_START=148 /DNA_END=591 /DNA_ORIENTATION=+